MAIKIKGISKSFGEDKIFDDFSLSLPDSGCICFFGPSGSGKTTFFNMLSGLLLPDKGSIDYPDNSKISFVFQEDRLLPWISASENIEQVLIQSDVNNAKATAEEWLDKLGLINAKDKLPSELSGGMRRRVALARALAYGGNVLLLDEPFSGIDAQTKDLAMKIIESQKKARLIVLITHYPQEAINMSDKIFVLHGPPVKIAKIIDVDDARRFDADYISSTLSSMGIQSSNSYQANE